MCAAAAPIRLDEHGELIRYIDQPYVPFKTPLGLPIVNPFAGKQMQFMKQYTLSGVELDEAATGVLFGNYRPFMDVKTESYSRARRMRTLVFNPFTVEMERIGGMAGEIGSSTGRSLASVMVNMLGTIQWEITQDPAASPDLVSFNFKTTSDLFWGHFKIRARRAPDGIVVLEDDWTTDGGSNMRTEYLAMANLVLLTHPRGFEQIAEEVAEEVKRARATGARYVGEIGAPSEDLDAGGTSVAPGSSGTTRR